MSEGDYIVIVARVENGRVVSTRPGATACGPGPQPLGKEAAQIQFKSGLAAVDAAIKRGSKGEPLTKFLERFR